MSDVYEYWRSACAGKPDADLMLPTIGAPIPGENPQPGEWRVRRKKGGPWVLLSLWLADDSGDPAMQWRAGLTLMGLLGNTEAPTTDEIARLWLFSQPVSDEDASHWRDRGCWPSDPPVAPKPDETAPPSRTRGEGWGGGAEVAAAVSSSPTANPGPGHNSGDPDSFEAMRAALEGDIADARAHFRKNPIRTKTDADLCENWRKRIFDAAKALDEKRKAEKKPHQDKADAVDAQYFPVIRSAQEFSGRNGPLDKMGQAFIAAEQARLRKEAEERAAAEHAARVAEAEAERKRREEERAAKLRDDPVAALTDPEPEPLPVPQAPSPILDAPKVMIGTHGSRRGAQAERHTATITDAAELAAHLVKTRHPDLMECLQKIASAAARGRARQTLPGVKMSWERGEAA